MICIRFPYDWFSCFPYGWFPLSNPAPCFHKGPTTKGAEKKSGVPYILTSQRRHRQTPRLKHDKKTRHVIAHAAQPSYSALVLEIGDFSLKRHTLLRTSADVAVRPWRTPRLACRRSRAVSAREYGKDQIVTRFPARQENYTTSRLQMASAGF